MGHRASSLVELSQHKHKHLLIDAEPQLVGSLRAENG